MMNEHMELVTKIEKKSKCTDKKSTANLKLNQEFEAISIKILKTEKPHSRTVVYAWHIRLHSFVTASIS